MIFWFTFWATKRSEKWSIVPNQTIPKRRMDQPPFAESDAIAFHGPQFPLINKQDDSKYYLNLTIFKMINK
jgi:hypothetical protein